MRKLLLTGFCCIAALPALAAEKTVTFKTPAGADAGSAALVDTPNGLLVKLDLRNIPPGEHALHFHETGVCNAADGFASAGGHYNPDHHSHGYNSEQGPHEGDMPNITIPADGTLRLDVFNEEVKMSELLEGDGGALVIHAKADDYVSQPSGNAGDRVACAEIKK